MASKRGPQTKQVGVISKSIREVDMTHSALAMKLTHAEQRNADNTLVDLTVRPFDLAKKRLEY
jgi:hypothetical protein